MPDLIGIDLAWQSDKNHSGLVHGSIHDDRVVVHRLLAGLARVDDIVEAVAELAGPDAVVAIDAPLIIENAAGQRPCETECGRRFGAAHASAHASNLGLYPDAGSVRLAGRLEAMGFSQRVLPAEARRRRGRWFFEVYPHPAHVVLFDRARIIKYKKGPVTERRTGLAEWRAAVLSLAFAEPSLDVSEVDASFFGEDIGALRGRALKEYEDKLDALFCAYLAGHYWYWGAERNEMLGDLETGNIVVPSAAAHVGPAAVPSPGPPRAVQAASGGDGSLAGGESEQGLGNWVDRLKAALARRFGGPREGEPTSRD